MIQEVVSVDLPVHERLVIKKNRLEPENMTGKEKRISIVTGTHGDELDGQYICYEIIKKIQMYPEKLKGIVDIYPDVNPLGIDMGSRGIPMFDLDMNRVFPGDNNGAVAEYTAAGLIDDIIGSDFCLDIHSSNIFLKEMPQLRMTEENKDKLLPYAKKLMLILYGYILLRQFLMQHLHTALIIWEFRHLLLRWELDTELIMNTVSSLLKVYLI